jgi:hypothetical protein
MTDPEHARLLDDAAKTQLAALRPALRTLREKWEAHTPNLNWIGSREHEQSARALFEACRVLLALVPEEKD